MKKIFWFLLGLLAGCIIGAGWLRISYAASSTCKISGGCTGVSSVPNGSMLFGSTTNQSLNVLPIGSSNTVLIPFNGAPSWQNTATLTTLSLTTKLNVYNPYYTFLLGDAAVFTYANTTWQNPLFQLTNSTAGASSKTVLRFQTPSYSSALSQDGSGNLSLESYFGDIYIGHKDYDYTFSNIYLLGGNATTPALTVTNTNKLKFPAAPYFQDLNGLILGKGDSPASAIANDTIFKVLRSAGTSAVPIYSDIGTLLTAGSNISITGTSTLAVSGIGSTIQGWDADLNTIAGLTKTKGNLIVGNGSNWEVLPVGEDGQVLTASSTASGGMTFSNTTPTGGTASGTPGAIQFAGAAGTFDSNDLFTISGLKLGVNTGTPIATLSVAGTAGTNPLQIVSSTGASLLMIDQAGKIGFSSTSPTFGFTLTPTRSGPASSTMFYFRDITPTTGQTRMILREGEGQGGLPIFDVRSSSDTTSYFQVVGATAVNGIKATNIFPFSSPLILYGTRTTSSGANVSIESLNLMFPTTGTSSQLIVTNGSYPFQPRSGTAVLNIFEVQGMSIDQRSTASGITRGIYLNPTLTSVRDFRFLEIASDQTATIATSSILSIAYNTLLNPITYTSASSSQYTLANASTLNVAGAPKGTTATALIASSTALSIQSNALTNVTNAYSLYVNTPTGAASNYAAAFMGGNVGINTSTPATALDVSGAVTIRSGGSANHAICWKADGVTLGYCSTIVGADGTCTCN